MTVSRRLRNHSFISVSVRPLAATMVDVFAMAVSAVVISSVVIVAVIGIAVYMITSDEKKKSHKSELLLTTMPKRSDADQISLSEMGSESVF